MGGVETKRPHGGSTERQSEGKMGKFSGYSNTCFYSNRLPSLRLSLSVLCGRFNYDEEYTVSSRHSVAGHRSWYTPYLLREFSVLDSHKVYHSSLHSVSCSARWKLVSWGKRPRRVRYR